MSRRTLLTCFREQPRCYSPRRISASRFGRVCGGYSSCGQVEGGEGSAIDLSMVLSGVTDALAMLLVETMPTSPKDRREVADQVRRQLIVTVNRFAEMKAAGDWDGWGMAKIGAPN
jgi:hypothetical protein